jgi:hypothetical protein
MVRTQCPVCPGLVHHKSETLGASAGFEFEARLRAALRECDDNAGDRQKYR